jgi:hypothetical protein
MSNKSRALEMFESGKRADCVIEVMPQMNDQEKQVFFCFSWYCILLISYPTWYWFRFPTQK